jgi:hypothetical protein
VKRRATLNIYDNRLVFRASNGTELTTITLSSPRSAQRGRENFIRAAAQIPEVREEVFRQLREED